ncbi:hypothetical protein KAW38_02645 [Candidatus Micrarchaeota archaeon]|nr:hypothetical protein [Candidatus Micrarchaeota archaeon]
MKVEIQIDDLGVSEFQKDLKKLCKKYRNLQKDFERLKSVLRVEPTNKANRVDELGKSVEVPIYKVKKFRSTDFKGKGNKSGFRVIYAYGEEQGKIIMIQIYHKNKTKDLDRERVYTYFKR